MKRKNKNEPNAYGSPPAGPVQSTVAPDAATPPEGNGVVKPDEFHVELDPSVREARRVTGDRDPEIRKKISVTDVKSQIKFKTILRETANSYKFIKATKYGAGPMLIVMFVTYVQSFDNSIIAAMGPELRREFGTSLLRMFTINSVVGFFLLIASPPIGWLSDRTRHRAHIVGISSILSGIATVASTFTRGIGAFSAARGFNQFSERLGGVPLGALNLDYYPVEARGRIVSFKEVATELPELFTGLIVAYIATNFGWRGPVRIVGPLLIASGLFAAFKLPEPVRGYWERRRLGVPEGLASEEEPPIGLGEAFRTIFAVRTIRRTMLASVVTGVGLSGFALMPFFLLEQFSLNPLQRSLLGIPTQILGLFAIVIGGTLTDQLIRKRPGKMLMVTAAMGAATIFSQITIVAFPSIALIIFFNMIFTVARSFISPSMATVGSLVVPPRVRGAFVGVSSILALPLLVLGPLPAYLGETYGLRLGIVMLTPLAFLGSFISASAASLFEVDMRAALASANATTEYRKAKEEGRIKLLLCKDLDVHYGTVQILFNVDFVVGEGETVALLGTNGAGKSTLLRAVSGIAHASNGAILYEGRNITHIPPHEIARMGIVHMPGGRGVFPSLTVKENLEFAISELEEEEAKQRLAQVFEYFPKLKELYGTNAGLLSGGEQQMVALAQAFLAKPRLLMIDELSLGLSPAVVSQLLEIVKIIAAQGTTVILVEQSVNVALTVAERAVFMEKGEIKFDGPTADLLNRPDIMRAIYLKGSAGLIEGGSEAKRLLEEAKIKGESHVILELQGLTKTYGGKTAVDNVDLVINEGEAIGFIGPNGAGKTTLFDLISGYVPPDSGKVIYDGVDITKLGADKRAKLKLIRRFQEGRLFPSLTVFEAICVALDQGMEVRSTFVTALQVPAVRKAEGRVRARAERLIGILELGSYRDKFVNELSTGLKRVVDLACVLAAKPRVLLLDEPSSGIAQAEAEGLVPLLRRVRYETGCTLLIIEHDMPLISKVADELVAMISGAVITRGKPDEVLNHPDVVEAYLGNSEAALNRSGSKNLLKLDGGKKLNGGKK